VEAMGAVLHLGQAHHLHHHLSRQPTLQVQDLLGATLVLAPELVMVAGLVQRLLDSHEAPLIRIGNRVESSLQ
jgi:hypothetical protein